MTERAPKYQHLALPDHDIVGVDVLNWLVQEGRLPHDITVRVKAEAKRRGDDYKGEHYERLLSEIVILAIKQESLPAFLDAPLPNSFVFFAAGDYDGPTPLSLLSEDFHRFSTLYRAAEKFDIKPNYMYPLWHRLITEVDPSTGLMLESIRRDQEDKSRESRFIHQVQHTIVKDEPAFEVYNDQKARSRLSRSIGVRCLLPLGHILADNHPELVLELDAS